MENLFSRLITGVKVILRDIRVPIYFVEQNHFRAIYIGCASLDPYITRMIYGNSLTKNPEKNIWIWNLKKTIKKLEKTYDITFIHINRVFIKYLKLDNYFYIPHFVEQAKKISWGKNDDVMKAIKNSTNEDDLRKIRKYKHDYEIVRDKKFLKEFYDNYYRPLIEKKHKEAAFIVPWKKFEKECRYGDLIMVKGEEGYISGMFCKQEGDVYRSLFAGLKNADLRLQKRGALTAEFVFFTIEATKRECREISHGRSRAFLNDGLLVSKKKWDTFIRMNVQEPRDMLLTLNRANEQVKAFLINHPFIFYMKRNLWGIVVLNNEADMTDKDIKRSLKLYFHEGMSSLFVLYDKPEMKERLERIASEHHLKIKTIITDFESNNFHKHITNEIKRYVNG